MRFIVPTNVEALGSFNASARAVIPFYINPDSFQIQDKKIIQKTLTKGGFSVQYWGEDLSMLNVSGTTGSGGIEAAYVLRDVYRHEQLQMNKIILARLMEAQQAATQALQNADTPPESFLGLVDDLTGGAISQIVDGTASIIQAVTDAFNGELGTEVVERILLTPTPAAFATSIDLYFSGERYRGYFESFSITETSQNPGIINYQFASVITRRWGTRSNYMPWHRNPRNSAGDPVPASPPLQGAATHELSFPISGSTQESLTNPALRSKLDTENVFVSDVQTPETNAVPLNRSSSIK